jgi:hypothetical protein
MPFNASNTGDGLIAKAGPDPDARPAPRTTLPRASGALGPTSRDAMAAACGSVPGSEATRVVVADLAKATTSGSDTPLAPGRYASRPGGPGRHPVSGRFTSSENIAAGARTLDQQPHNADQFPGGRSGPNVGTPQPVTATPPNPHHVNGGPAGEQLKHPPAPATVQRLDLAGAVHPQFAEQLAHPVNPNPMAHVLASPAEHLGTTPRPRSMTPADIPTGPPDIVGRAAAAPLAGAIAAHMGAPPPFGIQTVEATCRPPWCE